MRVSSILCFLILGSTTIAALPVETRQYPGIIDNSLLSRTITSIASRADKDKQMAKAGAVLDKVGWGLTAATAAANAVPILGQVASAALAVVRTACKVFSKIMSAISNVVHKDKEKRKAFTKAVVDETLEQHPGWNIVVVHPSHEKNFKGDWAQDEQTLTLKLPVHKKIKYQIYTFREGSFRLNGDGGYENWAYGGNVTKDEPGKKNHYLEFGLSPQAQGSAAEAIKGAGQQAAKDAPKLAKEAEKKEASKTGTVKKVAAVAKKK